MICFQFLRIKLDISCSFFHIVYQFHIPRSTESGARPQSPGPTRSPPSGGPAGPVPRATSIGVGPGCGPGTAAGRPLDSLSRAADDMPAASPGSRRGPAPTRSGSGRRRGALRRDPQAGRLSGPAGPPGTQESMIRARPGTASMQCHNPIMRLARRARRARARAVPDPPPLVAPGPRLGVTSFPAATKMSHVHGERLAASSQGPAAPDCIQV